MELREAFFKISLFPKKSFLSKGEENFPINLARFFSGDIVSFVLIVTRCW